MTRTITSLLICVLGALVSAQAAVVISLGNISLPANTNNCSFDIVVSGGETVTDMVAYFEVAGGGPFYGGQAGPQITAIDFGAGTIWAPVSGGFTAANSVTYPTQLQEISLSLNQPSSQALATGKLCRVTLDTTGFTGGNFTFKMTATVGGNTSFGNGTSAVVSQIANGTLWVGQAPPAPVPVAPPVALQRLVNKQVQLSFPTVVGLNYTIQWDSDLVPPWNTLSNPLPGTGSTVVWTDDGSLTGSSPALSTRRFYRILVQP